MRSVTKLRSVLWGSLACGAMIVAFAVLHGWAWGARGPLMQAIRADYFGTASFGKIMGISTMIVSPPCGL